MAVLGLVPSSLPSVSFSSSSSSRSQRTWHHLLSPRMQAEGVLSPWRMLQTRSRCCWRRGRGGCDTLSFSPMPASRFEGFRFWHSDDRILSDGKSHIYRNGLPVLQKEVHMDWWGQLDHLVQPSQVETCHMCLMNTICVFQGLTPPLVTWLPSSWSCPCLFVLSSFMIWALLSSPSCRKYETLPFNAQFWWLLHGFKNPPYLIY